MNTEDLSSILCKSLCANAAVTQAEQGLWRVRTPFEFPDGDGYSLYVRQLPSGGVRVSDMGATLMHLSYQSDVGKLREGTRGRILGEILGDADVEEDDGEFYVESALDDLGAGVFRLGQALTRIHDLSFLNRVRAESTFYEDLGKALRSIVGSERVEEKHVVASVPRAADYPVDYFVSGGSLPLYVFGVPSQDKAQLATIILQHFIVSEARFNSMVVFRDMGSLARPTVSRLTNAANDQVDSLDAEPDLRRKLLQRIS